MEIPPPPSHDDGIRSLDIQFLWSGYQFEAGGGLQSQVYPKNVTYQIASQILGVLLVGLMIWAALIMLMVRNKGTPAGSEPWREYQMIHRSIVQMWNCSFNIHRGMEGCYTYTW